jgi:hypothetical protein
LAAVAPAAPPADITGSVPNAATPAPAMPQAAAPQAKKPAPKVARKPAKKIRKVTRKPAQIHRVATKRIVRRARPPADASSAQPAASFDNPVFASAPQFQKPAKRRVAAKKAATNNGVSNPFGAQFNTH